MDKEIPQHNFDDRKIVYGKTASTLTKAMEHLGIKHQYVGMDYPSFDRIEVMLPQLQKWRTLIGANGYGQGQRGMSDLEVSYDASLCAYPTQRI